MPEGERLLSRTPSRIDMNLLREYPGYAEWIKQAQTPSANKEAAPGQADNLKDTPEEALDRAASAKRTNRPGSISTRCWNVSARVSSC